MRMPALLTRRGDSLPGLVGIARSDRNTSRLLRRIGPGEIAVLDEVDLDRLTAETLVKVGVAAVVNASPSISGRYPNQGPDVLVAGGVELVDSVGAEVFKKVRDGSRVRISEGVLYSGDRMLVEGTELDRLEIAALVSEARKGLAAHLEAFSGNMIELIRSESPLLLDGIGVPDVRLSFEGRHVVVVADGPGHMGDLKHLRPFIREYCPILVGVDSGADSLMRSGYRPDLIIGDPDKISSHALRSGAEVVLPADTDGHAPGLHRIQDLGIGAVTFPATGSAMDLALLLLDHHGASLIVTVGSNVSFEEFVDRGSGGGSPAAFLTRLKVGPKVVDAKAVATLYHSRVSGAVIALLVVSALAAAAVAIMVTSGGADVLDWGIHLWNRLALKAQRILG